MSLRSRSDVVHIPGTAKTFRKRGATRFDPRDPYFLVTTASWPRFILGALIVVTGVHLLFALLYLAKPGAVHNLPPGNLLYALFFSLETLATVGYGEMTPGSTYGHVVASAEIEFGMAFTAILTGILFVRFSKPRPSFRFADTLVVAKRDGTPTLMARVANGRLTMLMGANAEIGLLVTEQSAEGQTNRRFHDLPLLRSKIPVFPLTWTLMHAIDADSPLAGLDPESLARSDAQVFVTVEARDVALDARLTDVRSYACDAICFGKRYVRAVTQAESGDPTADLSKLSLIEPDEGPYQGGELI